jgi:fatty acid desaturase
VVVDISEAMEDSMDSQERRDAAIKRIKDKRDFKTHVVSYVVVNLFLVGVWAVSGGGYFWPGWVMAGWGIGLVLHGWQTYRGEKPITEEDIQREMD